MIFGLFVSTLGLPFPDCLRGDDTSGGKTAEGSPAKIVDAGHSYHGEAFDDGPRQAAHLMAGMAKITFPTSAKSTETQAFVEQGISQLHGFLYLEAERSFRQAAHNEPELGIAYWGCAKANINNLDRAKKFSAEAMKRVNKPTSQREKLYIESLDRFLNALPDSKENDNDKKPDSKSADNSTKKKDAQERYISDLEKIIDDFPDEIEAKACLVLQLWLASSDGVKMPSRYAVDALLNGIFAAEPMHPAHHYRIHLWDDKRPKNAIESAAKAGPSMPGVAHMWHMPGHTYSKLHRYADAAWQQEAAARVDHAYMIDARLMPDQIHNFSHNNEWMIRNLIFLGRVDDAVRHSKNLTSLPQHPDYNTSKKGSFRFGRDRLLTTLTSFGLWKQLIDETAGVYLADTESNEANLERDAWLAVANFIENNRKLGGTQLRTLQRKLLSLQEKTLDAADAKADTKVIAEAAADKDEAAADDKTKTESEDIKKQIKLLRRLISRVAAAAAAMRGDKEAVNRYAKNADLDSVLHAQWLVIAKDLEGAQKLAEKAVKDSPGQVRPLAVLIDILWRREKREDAMKHFKALRDVAHSADLDTPMLAVLAPVALEAKVEVDSRKARKLPSDVGQRPDLDSLGPASWQPYASMPIVAFKPDGSEMTSSQWDGKPKVVVFYLGFGCLHCVEQLKALGPKVEEFRALGVEMLAISNESLETLTKGIENFGETLPIPLFTNPDQTVFKAFRCWDDFESLPMHGIFLIDAKGRVRWQDIGAEPFTDAAFLVAETKRLLALPD